MSRGVSPDEEAPVAAATPNSSAFATSYRDGSSNVSNRKPSFPGDFIENLNEQACVTKIQTEIFATGFDVLAVIATRNTWFENKVENE